MLAAVQGTYVLTHSAHSPSLLEGQVSRLERWIDGAVALCAARPSMSRPTATPELR
ncbi:hypothetical protein [Deinococcus sp.]|uniref:hypothetical protein n=1 Tax=Deinococcus sp. TaxID=47478 RepID=UPI003CC5F3FA